MIDPIDRKAAIDALDRFSLGETDAVKLAFRMGDYLKQLPSAQPDLQPTCNQLATDCIRRRDAVSRFSDLLLVELEGKRLPTWEEVYNAMQDLPAVEPERKRGTWEKVKGIEGAYDFRCSACHRFRFHNGEYLKKYNFCPNCGADMARRSEE